MCGRFTRNYTWAQIHAFYGLVAPSGYIPNLQPRFNICPTDTVAPFIIRWGPDTSSDMIRTQLRCSKCGRLGYTIRRPGWQDKNVGWRAFPVEKDENATP